MTAASDAMPTAADDHGTGALSGLRVVEVGHLIAGPFCGHLFADHGAEVIKVEPLTGDPMRKWGSMYRGVGLYWPVIGRQKRSVTLDLRDPEGAEALRRLLMTADVLIENFRPGTLESWGLDVETLRAANPKLVVVRVTGFGQTGPYRDRAGFGSVAEAMGGLRHLTGEIGRPPVRVGISIGDSLAATQAFVGALMALYRRDRPGGLGTGQVVDVGLFEAVWMYMEAMLPEYEKLGTVKGPTGAVLPGIAPSSVYPTADGHWIVIGANQDSVFQRLADAMGREDWVSPDSRFATHEGRGASQVELDEAIAAWTSRLAADHLLERMEAVGVPASRIYSVSDIAEDPHYRARDMIISVEEPNLDGERVSMQGIVPKLAVTPGGASRGAPTLGEHDDEIWHPLLGQACLDDLRARGVISQP